MDQINRKRVNLPLTHSVINDLRAGDVLLLSGYLYTARDAAHMKLIDMIEKNENLPFSLQGQTIYYTGPCPSRPGEIIGSSGPTTSGRMGKYAKVLLEHQGLLGMIGKGAISSEVIDEIIKRKAVYLGATGGAGALISQCIRSSEVIAFPELGTEAIRKLRVENFPVIVLIDSKGNNLYVKGKEKYCIKESED